MDAIGAIVFVVCVVVVSAIVLVSLRIELEVGWTLPAAAFGVALGGFAGSEWFGPWSDWGPTIDGLNILPSLLGMALIGWLAALSTLAPPQELHP
ncbi:MAG TPA: hypothetical protein VNL92_02890 [Dehalococcoidia bacterium]|nr:hypothetical protein [Dehalococcoidia bacterium]